MGSPNSGLPFGQLQPPSLMTSFAQPSSSQLNAESSGSGGGGLSPQLLSAMFQQNLASTQHLQPQSSQERRSSSPGSPGGKPSGGNTFVHKLHDMVTDPAYQHLISWNYTGASFVVCCINDLARDVLPKHFKHSNFSSFVRQLNMYGFHKINKSPRGQRTAAENQIWEFSHPKFLRGRPDLLEEIKRKAMDSDHMRRETGDLHANLTMMQATQVNTNKHVEQLQQNLTEVVRELAEMKQRQAAQQDVIMRLVIHLQSQGHVIPTELLAGLEASAASSRNDAERPSIVVTNHDHANASAGLSPIAMSAYNLTPSWSGLSSPASDYSPLATTFAGAAGGNGANIHLQIDSHNLAAALAVAGSPGHSRPVSPNSFTMYNHALNTPLPPSPIPPYSPLSNGMLSEDDLEHITPALLSSRPSSFYGSDQNESMRLEL
ncbi:hypothetical protein H4R34_001660 [Dimargaris verticillata]|uniref:HSF-type DNA-binding domain-containing protein n=1 Tax=Dimargaris verticillata TaxID=2761393 RepID=A0A9W8B374_9FUNG|nr:hypothetical protein H4R34_001660 [Dimargaris verticillata]